MNQRINSENKELQIFYSKLEELHKELDSHFITTFDRSLPLNEEVSDRWERASKLGFGAKSSIYDSSFVFGKVIVGENCWIGPFTVIDGSGGLKIGNNCTVSVGVHIYTHDNLKQTLSGGKLPIEREGTSIGDCTYIGPQSIITKGLKIGKHCVIASNSFVNSNMEDYSIYAGNPAKKIGSVIINNNDISFEYSKK